MLPLKIFVNNLTVALIIYALSVTIAGSWIFFAFQGFFTGAISSAPLLDEELLREIRTYLQCTLDQQGLALVKASLLIPHGIFEISGIALSLVASYHISRIVIDLIRAKILRTPVTINVRGRVIASLKLLLVAVILLLVAAFIEIFVTPVIGGVVMALLCFLR